MFVVIFPELVDAVSLVVVFIELSVFLARCKHAYLLDVFGVGKRNKLFPIQGLVLKMLDKILSKIEIQVKFRLNYSYKDCHCY
jgi:hypothetical protein